MLQNKFYSVVVLQIPNSILAEESSKKFTTGVLRWLHHMMDLFYLFFIFWLNKSKLEHKSWNLSQLYGFKFPTTCLSLPRFTSFWYLFNFRHEFDWLHSWSWVVKVITAFFFFLLDSICKRLKSYELMANFNSRCIQAKKWQNIEPEEISSSERKKVYIKNFK